VQLQLFCSQMTQGMWCSIARQNKMFRNRHMISGRCE
jgi:hypothetical protein